jgi:hypothetical protein
MQANLVLINWSAASWLPILSASGLSDAKHPNLSTVCTQLATNRMKFSSS